jgi:hypothetical protein
MTKRNFTPEESMELLELNRIVSARKFEAAQIAGNTTLIPNGQKVAEQTTAIAALLDNAKNLWVSQKVVECGYPQDTKCSINLSTGEIVVQ